MLLLSEGNREWINLLTNPHRIAPFGTKVGGGDNESSSSSSSNSSGGSTSAGGTGASSGVGLGAVEGPSAPPATLMEEDSSWRFDIKAGMLIDARDPLGAWYQVSSLFYSISPLLQDFYSLFEDIDPPFTGPRYPCTVAN
jgi:hypothetical protein